MAFFGLTYLGPQNNYQHHDLNPNEHNTKLRESIGFKNLPSDMQKIQFGKDAVDEEELFEDDPAYWLLKSAMKKRPAKAVYVSHRAMQEDKFAYKVKHSDPSTQWTKPLVSSHEFGWEKPQYGGIVTKQADDVNPCSSLVGQLGQRRYPLRSSEVTQFQREMVKYNQV
eukprot:NODE_8544_length_669_cov_40.620879_g7920_i0.p1 GENE.NODE_8544_length_669_cov_40.620879_g7920_i0~~NODE_8544_length_669_cov_40.620879_g7920_i0.p1  ORF type:complete len:177 (-),score=45.88 NODE_8544_length_669_cov_40.620879_g7920_i0:137-640(-)